MDQKTAPPRMTAEDAQPFVGLLVEYQTAGDDGSARYGHGDLVGLTPDGTGLVFEDGDGDQFLVPVHAVFWMSNAGDDFESVEDFGQPDRTAL